MSETSIDTPRKIVYEWVLTMSKGDNVVLTERQYDFYRQRVEREDFSKLFFPNSMVNPSFVVSAYKRPAEYIKNQYPCPRCHQSGYDPEDRIRWCDNCGGSGVQLPT